MARVLVIDDAEAIGAAVESGLVAANRYAFKAVARQLADAQQQIGAQCRMPAGR